MKVGKSIQEIRKDNGLSQEEFGKMFHVTRQTVSNWENEKSYPDLQTLILISDKFDVSLDKLMKEDPAIVQEIDGNRKRVTNITLFLTGCLPFITGFLTSCWDRFVPFHTWGLIGHLLWLAIWGIVCYKVANPDKRLFQQVLLLNIGGLISLVGNVLVQLGIMESLRCGPFLLNNYMDHSLLYPWRIYIILINRSISLVNSGVTSAMDWHEKSIIPVTVYVFIVAWFIMLAICMLAVVLKIKGYSFRFSISKKKE